LRDAITEASRLGAVEDAVLKSAQAGESGSGVPEMLVVDCDQIRNILGGM